MKSKKSNTRSPKSNRAFVTANFALTWDGKIATRTRSPSIFSSPADKRMLLEIRAGCDAVLVGKSTLIRDNMSMALPAEDLMAVRVAKGLPPCPIRVLISNSGKLSPSLRVFQNQAAPTHIFSTTKMPGRFRKQLQTKAELHLTKADQVDLRRMLRDLRAKHGVKRVVCEGGAALFRSLLELDLVDELHLTFCPFLFGGKDALTLTGTPGFFLPKQIRLKLASLKVVGHECFLRYQR